MSDRLPPQMTCWQFLATMYALRLTMAAPQPRLESMVLEQVLTSQAHQLTAIQVEPTLNDV